MSDKDKEKVLDTCRRIERALQRDWGSTGTGLRERHRLTRYAVLVALRKRGSGPFAILGVVDERCGGGLRRQDARPDLVALTLDTINGGFAG